VWFVGAPVSLAADPPEMARLDPVFVATSPADRHITLAFFGRAPRATVEQVWLSLPQLSLPRETRPLRWELFGRRALALSLADDDGLLGAAAEACHDAANELIDLRRPPEFRPHVTLARVPRRARPPSRGNLRGWAVPAGLVDVGCLTLFRSREDPTGDRYERVDQH
jgi:2'-5' RNA ligase